MKFILLALAVGVIAYLVINSAKNRNPYAEACAKDVIQLLKKRQDASPDEIAAIFKQHEVPKEHLDNVTTLVKARLHQINISKDKHALLMLEIRKAKDKYLEE